MLGIVGLLCELHTSYTRGAELFVHVRARVGPELPSAFCTCSVVPMVGSHPELVQSIVVLLPRRCCLPSDITKSTGVHLIYT